ncbi:MAG: hypothetical protein ABRQ37_09280 [Candidatus Eremiobacterota bacterium]
MDVMVYSSLTIYNLNLNEALDKNYEEVIYLTGMAEAATTRYENE